MYIIDRLLFVYYLPGEYYVLRVWSQMDSTNRSRMGGGGGGCNHDHAYPIMSPLTWHSSVMNGRRNVMYPAGGVSQRWHQVLAIDLLGLPLNIDRIYMGW